MPEEDEAVMGLNIINKKSNGAVHIDRKLVTGDGPQAANAFGRLAATTLLEHTNKNS